MKTYEIELKRISYITVIINASSPEEAEEKAWSELKNNNHYKDASLEFESIEELK